MATITTPSPTTTPPLPNTLFAIPIPAHIVLATQTHHHQLTQLHIGYAACINDINDNVAKYLAIMDIALYMIQEAEAGWPADLPEIPTQLVEAHGKWLNNCLNVDLANSTFVAYTMHLHGLAQKAANDFELWYAMNALRYIEELKRRMKEFNGNS